MNKKAMQESLLTMIIGVVIFILMLGLNNVINATLSEARHREVCRLSIAEVELAKKATLETLKPQIDCPMSVTDIEKDDLPKDEAKAADLVKREFAQAMYDTWYVSAQGEHRTFQQRIFTKGNVHCLLYSRINLHDIDEALNKEDLGGMTSWLTVNNPPESSKSYFTHLTYENKRAFFIIDASDPDRIRIADEIDPSKDYYVVFWASFEEGGIIGKLNIIGDVAKVIREVLEERWFPQVIVVPEEQFEHIGCEALLN